MADNSIDNLNPELALQHFIEQQIQHLAKGQPDVLNTNLFLSALADQLQQSEEANDFDINTEMSANTLATMPEINDFSFNGPKRLRIKDLAYEFSKLQEAAGREYFRCIGCRQRRDYLKKMGNPVPLLGSIVYLQASNKLVGDPQSPGGYPHICEGKFMCTTRRPSDRPRVLHDDALASAGLNSNTTLTSLSSSKSIITNSSNSNSIGPININAIHQPITSSSPKMNIPVMTLAEAKSRMSSVPRISIPSEKYPKHTYIFQRLQHIYKATPPYTYFNCLSCKRLCAKWQNTPTKKHYIPKLRLSENGEILPWGTADRPHNGPHYCIGEETPTTNDSLTAEQQRAMEIVNQVVETLQPNSDQETVVSTLHLNRRPSNASISSIGQNFRNNDSASPNSSIDGQCVESSNNELSLQKQINEIRNILLMMQTAQSLSKAPNQNIQVVISKSSISKNIDIDCQENIVKEWYPHADNRVPIIEV
uniref:Uncharacterized protein n=1 Tax=Acrobeloides nanus TaxID=290746 RepID=A0A914CUS9_9BILA